MGARKSTAASRLRSAQKYIASAEHRHRQAIKDIARLRPAERRLENVRAERLLLAGNGERAAYSRFDVERALYLYLSDGGSASISTHVSDVRDIGGEWGDREGPEAAAISEAETGVSVTSMRRTRNVFGKRASSPHRGRKNRGPLPRGAGNPPALMVRRADLQRVMRMIPARSAEVAFWRAVADLEFKEVGDIYAYSSQAAQKAYRKALTDLQTALNLGQSGVGRTGRERQLEAQDVARHAELVTLEIDLGHVVAWLRVQERRAAQMQMRLTRLYRDLPQLELEAISETRASDQMAA